MVVLISSVSKIPQVHVLVDGILYTMHSMYHKIMLTACVSDLIMTVDNGYSIQ